MSVPTNAPPPIAAPVRPLVDRRRSSSRERGVLHRQSSSQSSATLQHSLSEGGAPQGLRPALKWNTQSPTPPQHQINIEPPTPAANSPAKDADPLQQDGYASFRPRRASGGSMGKMKKSLSEVSLTSKDGRLDPSYRRRVGFDTFGAGNDLEGKAVSTGGGTGESPSLSRLFRWEAKWGERAISSASSLPA